MPTPSNIVRFPDHRDDDITVTEVAFALLCDAVAPYHGTDISGLLARATPTRGGRCIVGTCAELTSLMEAIGVEAYGFLKVEEEKAGRILDAPKRGGTAARLFAIYDRLEEQLS